MYKVHDVEWNEESIARFWDYISSKKEIESTYCSNQIGDLIVDFVQKKT